MSELTFTFLRLGFLALLWLLVLWALRVLSRDVIGASPSTRSSLLRRHPTAADNPTGKKPPISRHTRKPAKLVITEGPLAGSTVPLSPSSIVIGRSPACTLVLDDDYSSGRHARIFPKDGLWWVEDLGSTNGTFLNGSPVKSVVELPAGVPLRIGQTSLELRP